MEYQIDHLQEDYRRIVQTKVLPISVRVLQEHIKVKHPTVGNLTLPVVCDSVFVPGNDCASVVDPSSMPCGDARISNEHYGAYEICHYTDSLQFSCEQKSFGERSWVCRKRIWTAWTHLYWVLVVSLPTGFALRCFPNQFVRSKTIACDLVPRQFIPMFK